MGLTRAISAVILLGAVLGAQGNYSVRQVDGKWRFLTPEGRAFFYRGGGAGQPSFAWFSPAGNGFPDVFDPAFQSELQRRVGNLCRERSDDRLLIGYAWTDPPAAQPWVSAIRRLTPESAGKQIYIDFLKSKYGYNISRVNEGYGLEAGAFTDLMEGDFRGLDVKRATVQADDAEFRTILVERLYQLAASAFREAAPGRLLAAPDSGTLVDLVIVRWKSGSELPIDKPSLLVGSEPVDPFPAAVAGILR